MAVPSDHDIILGLGEDLPVGIWVARVPGGEQVYINRTFAQILGTGLEPDAHAGNYSEPYGICTRDGKPYPEDRLPFVRAIQEKRVVVIDDIMIRRPDRSCVDVRAFARPCFDLDGVLTHVVIAFFDITREVEAERAQAESEKRLQRAQRLEAIGTLAGGIAHDFNNLTFGIKLIASELAATETDPKRKTSLALIDDITDRSAALTRSLLGFARRGTHRAQPIALSTVVASVAELLRRTGAGAEFEFELLAKRGGIVVGDQSQLEQVVMNLVGNARDAVAGTGRILVRTCDRERDGRPHVVLEVADDGPGIPVEIRDRVFEPYLTTKTMGPDHGTGLGLATAYGIVEQHGGSIEIDRGLDGRGTTMRVWLPASTQALETVTAAARTAVRRGRGLLLVVDDDDIVRRALVSVLVSLGYETLDAAGGADALALFRAHRQRVDIVLLDMLMPGMNGRATYLAMRDVDPDVRVVLMSGYTLNEDVQEILDLGVRAYVPKPHAPEELAQALATALDG